jgi:hypothetical protein
VNAILLLLKKISDIISQQHVSTIVSHRFLKITYGSLNMLLRECDNILIIIVIIIIIIIVIVIIIKVVLTMCSTRYRNWYCELSSTTGTTVVCSHASTGQFSVQIKVNGKCHPMTRTGGGGCVEAPQPGEQLVSIVHEVGWASGPVWSDGENVACTGIGSPDRSARSESLYRPRYTGRHADNGNDLNFGLHCHLFTQAVLTNRNHKQVAQYAHSMPSA